MALGGSAYFLYSLFFSLQRLPELRPPLPHIVYFLFWFLLSPVFLLHILTGLDKICQLINVPKMASRSAGKILKCKFSSFLAPGGKCIKLGVYGINHNKLRTYSLFKGFFGAETILIFIRNRSQRAYLKYLYISSAKNIFSLYTAANTY